MAKRTSLIPEDLTREEAGDWLDLIKYAADGSNTPAYLMLCVTYQTFNRWCAGDYQRDWWQRERYRVVAELYLHFYKDELEHRHLIPVRKSRYTAKVKRIEEDLARLPNDRPDISSVIAPKINEAIQKAVKKRIMADKSLDYNNLCDEFIDEVDSREMQDIIESLGYDIELDFSLTKRHGRPGDGMRSLADIPDDD